MRELAIFASSVHDPNKIKDQSKRIEQEEVKGQDNFLSLLNAFVLPQVQKRNNDAFFLRDLSLNDPRRSEGNRYQQSRDSRASSYSQANNERRSDHKALSSDHASRQKKDHESTGKARNAQSNESTGKVDKSDESIKRHRIELENRSKESYTIKGNHESKVADFKEVAVLSNDENQLLTNQFSKEKATQLKVMEESASKKKNEKALLFKDREGQMGELEEIEAQGKKKVLQERGSLLISGKQNREDLSIKISEENSKHFLEPEPAQLPLLAKLQKAREKHKSRQEGKVAETTFIEQKDQEKVGLQNPLLPFQHVVRQEGSIQQPIGHQAMVRDGIFQEHNEKSLQSKNNLSNYAGVTETNRPFFKGKISNLAKQAPMPQRQEVFSQIIAQAKLLNKAGAQELKIQLKPDFLGPLKMRLIMEDGLVSIRIAAENPHIRQMIESNLSHLKQSLEEQGVKFDRIEVNQGESNKDMFRDKNQQDFLQNQQGRRQEEGIPTYTKDRELGESDELDSSDKVERYYGQESSTIEYLA
ncbi:flagellar hook-length control protein FliK [Heliorestis convoluta]|uniref:Flagellar hook-length control protein FliK n=1 Tax=Heliorestis convoluta TaxID=356322 RepID=A0A5Q2N2S2_9FIRM|nr:flagellar hook-length control protein FliK [Heliorestis convoluta]QGG48173.1 Flagellar hook-length control protein FliK [Heliorestis convoluta]